MSTATSRLRSAPEPPRPGGKRARTRRALLDAAGVVFDRRSVDHATVEEIAETAGVSVGTVYSHFGSKETLALAFIDEAFAVMEGYLEEARRAGSPLGRVLGAGDAYLRFVVEQPTAVRYGMARGFLPPQDHQDELAQAITARVQRALLAVATDLKTSMDQAEIPAVPIDEAMVFLWGAWMGVASMVVRQDALVIPIETAERALARGRRMLFAALTTEPLPGDALAEQLAAFHARKLS